MKVLIACEFSGIVRDAFRARGHDALSCDLLPTEINGPHYQGDVQDILNDSWDLMIAHPPCTYLCVSGARWFKDRQVEQAQALDFVRCLLNANIPHIALENPISVISSHIRKPDQIVTPFMFGHGCTKKTCLWLKNLPKLKATNSVEPMYAFTRSGKRYDAWWLWTSSLPTKGGVRSAARSRTFRGIADAMAEQWGGLAT